MVSIAGRITSFLQIEHTSEVAFGMLTEQVSVFLFRIDILDKTFLRLDIERDGIVLVGVLSHLEHRLTYQFRHCGIRIGRSGIHQVTIKTHIDLVALEIHNLILHVGFTKKMSRLRCGIIDQRVLGRVFHWSLNGVLPHLVQTISTDRIIHRLVVPIDSQLQGIHSEGIRNITDGITVLRNRETIGPMVTAETISPVCHHSYDDEQEKNYQCLIPHEPSETTTSVYFKVQKYEKEMRYRAH